MKILIAGDSYTFGQGCNDRLYYFDSKKWVGTPWPDNSGPSKFCWASLLQQHYPELTIVNKSTAGFDNTSILLEILNACVETTFDLIIFAGSYPERKQIAHSMDLDQVTTWIPGRQLSGSAGYLKAQEYYLRYLSHTVIDTNITTSNVLAAYGQAMLANSKFLWSLPKSNLVINLPDALKFHQICNVQDFDYSGVKDLKFNRIFEGPDEHINNTGHALYFEKQIVPSLRELKIIE